MGLILIYTLELEARESTDDGGSASSTSITEAFDFPSQCNVSSSTASTTTVDVGSTSAATTIGSASKFAHNINSCAFDF